MHSPLNYQSDIIISIVYNDIMYWLSSAKLSETHYSIAQSVFSTTIYILSRYTSLSFEESRGFESKVDHIPWDRTMQ